MIQTQIQQDVFIVKVVNHFSMDDVNDIFDNVEVFAVKGVLLDLTDVLSFHSTLFGLFVKLHKGLQEFGMQFGLVNIRPAGENLLNVIGINQLFPVFDTIKQGVDAFTRPV